MGETERERFTILRLWGQETHEVQRLNSIEMVIVVRGRVLEAVPNTLDEFFDGNPEIGMANVLLTEIEHTSMWRDQVLFIKQRQQATSDYRENKKVRWIEYLSDEGADEGLVEVTIVGGYEDARGDAAKNSLSLLHALQNDHRKVELKHFCVGPYNTKYIQEGEAKLGPHLRFGPKTAILKGIALDLKSQLIFPAIFDWCQFSDFDTQIKDKLRLRMGELPQDTEESNKTANSTFKPKSLKNKSSKIQDSPAKRKHSNRNKSEDNDHEKSFGVSLKPTGINENGNRNYKSKLNFYHLNKHES